MENKIIKFDKSYFNPHQNSLTKLVDDSISGLVPQLETYLFLKKLETCVKNGLSLLQDGATDEGAPGQRLPFFYGAYVRDADGNKLCFF